MRIALLQSTGTVEAGKENRARLEAAARTAADCGTELLLTPELFLSGYDPVRVNGDDGQEHRDWIAEIAASEGIRIAASTVEHREARSYISASIFDSTGDELSRYRKQHLFGAESGVFSPGTDVPELVPVGEFTAALGICFDIEFPEFAREQALRGADLLLIPTAVPLRSGRSGAPHPLDTRLVSTLLVPARALESQLYIAYANHIGPVFSGTSTVADPYGRRITTASEDSEEVIFADLDHSLVWQARTDICYLSYFNR